MGGANAFSNALATLFYLMASLLSRNALPDILVGMEVKALIVAFESRDSQALKELDRLATSVGSLLTCPWRTARLQDALEAQSEGTVVLPLLIQKGGLWRRLASSSMPVSAPLLSNDGDARQVAQILSSSLEEKEGHCYILVAHGEEGGHIEELDMLQRHLREDMVLVTLKEQLCWKFLSVDSRNVTLTPFLLGYGHHARKEVEGLVADHLRSLGHSVAVNRKGLACLSSDFARIFARHFDEELDKLALG